MLKKLSLVFFLILILFSVVYADTNGIWHHSTDIRGGIFGSDEQPITNYSFVNNVYFTKTIYTSKIVDIRNSLYSINLSGESNFNILTVNYLYTNNNVGIGTNNPQAKLDVRGGIKIGQTSLCNSNTEGTIRYNNSVQVMEFCDGTNWTLLGEEPSPKLAGGLSSYTEQDCLDNGGEVVAAGSINLCNYIPGTGGHDCTSLNCYTVYHPPSTILDYHFAAHPRYWSCPSGWNRYNNWGQYSVNGCWATQEGW